MNRKEMVLRFARQHGEDWKRASKSNAQIINEIVSVMKTEGCSRDEALDLADDTLRYMQRYF
ncbi:MAG: hypothetical protein ABSG16_03475 [Candidatus Acidiferrum sp.]